tara:strand:- start:439 stop:1134 length:696 start_codon:yes stop_codon:yes gene_type:complete
MSAILCLEGIYKRFGYQNILEDINFSIESGEFVVILGNNGVGKSTLLRIISSLMRPTNGKIFFKGEDQREILMLWLQRMGYISEETRLYSDLNSIENLRLYGTFYEAKNLNLKINDILEEIDLMHVAKMPIRNFSSGMKKRLMIGRLMLYEPEILLLDEPYTGLDVKSKKWFREFLEKFHKKGGTVLMVSHQFEQGMEITSRLLVIKNKKILKNLFINNLNSETLNYALEE